jgi:hypothetical protein
MIGDAHGFLLRQPYTLVNFDIFQEKFTSYTIYCFFIVYIYK